MADWTFSPIVAICVFQFLSCDATVGMAQDADVVISVCGPRCVQSILDHYKVESDLIPLVKEMQNGDPRSGCSLLDIKSALAKRDIHSKLVKLRWLEFPKWDHPVVLHYSRGHFVVLCETRGTHALIRDNAQMNPEWVSLESLFAEMSGNVLLTTPASLSEGADTAAFAETGFSITWPRTLFSVFLFTAGAFGIFILWRLKRFLESRSLISKPVRRSDEQKVEGVHP